MIGKLWKKIPIKCPNKGQVGKCITIDLIEKMQSVQCVRHDFMTVLGDTAGSKHQKITTWIWLLINKSVIIDGLQCLAWLIGHLVHKDK